MRGVRKDEAVNSTTNTHTKTPYEVITDKVISILESGQKTGSIQWHGMGNAGRIPYNFKTKKAYAGSNILTLWIAAQTFDYSSNAWMTFRQAADLGGHIKKGEKGTLGIYFDTIEVHDDKGANQDGGASRRIKMVKPFFVFNLDQTEGVDTGDSQFAWEPSATPEEVIQSTGARILEGGVRACYSSEKDVILVPDRHRFENPENFYKVVLHELSHWTGHETRLARDLKNRFGSEAYAMEELVAELSAAFLSAELGVNGRLEHHANYIGSWLRVLSNDKRAIVAAAAAASKAATFIFNPVAMSVTA